MKYITLVEMSKEVKLIKLILNRCEYVMSLDGEEWIIMIHVQQIKNQGQRLGSKILQYDAFIGEGETYEITKGLVILWWMFATLYLRLHARLIDL